MKKVFLTVLTLLLTVSLVGCSTSHDDNQEQPQNKDEASNLTVVDKNILIAYYSYSGNTEAAAKEIQNLTNGTLVSIEREEAYPEDYDEMTEIAEAEILNQETPTIKMDLVNLDDYDVVFVGYPIWWDQAPAMIRTFLTDYNFEGKIVIPFCTSSSDGIENSLEDFDDINGKAEITEGLRISDYEEISTWLQNINILEESK